MVVEAEPRKAVENLGAGRKVQRDSQRIETAKYVDRPLHPSRIQSDANLADVVQSVQQRVAKLFFRYTDDVEVRERTRMKSNLFNVDFGSTARTWLDEKVMHMARVSAKHSRCGRRLAL